MTPLPASSLRALLDPVVMGLVFYCLTSAVVLISVAATDEVLYGIHDRGQNGDFTDRCANWDGRHYQGIATRGYDYAPGRSHCNIVFWPLYPYAGRALAACGLRADLALLILSHVALAGTFVLMATFVRQRYPSAPPEVMDYTLLAMGLLPPTLFFRMAYTESLFLLFVAITLFGISRRWPITLVAAVAGLATGTRGAGLALVAPVALYAWRQLAPSEALSTLEENSQSLRTFAMRALRCTPFVLIASWGFLAFMGYQWLLFDDPFAFAKAQVLWRFRGDEDVTLLRKAVALILVEPIWSVYVPARPEFWARYEAHGNPLFSLHFANPLFFVGAVAAIVVGWRKRILNSYELTAAVGLLVIPYITKSYDNAMVSFGRFAAVVLPVYPVIGWALMRLGGPLSAALLAVSALFLALYSVLFALWYRII